MLLLQPVRASLDALRSGFLEAVPAVLLSKFTAEDFRLLLNGSPSVDIAVLKQRTHVSGDSRSTSYGSFVRTAVLVYLNVPFLPLSVKPSMRAGSGRLWVA
jgi:hypothetical protein